MAKVQGIISHWDQLIENFQTSSLAFYESVEQGLQKRAVPDFKAYRVEFKEAGVMTAKREYLRIVRGKCTFDICAAPFGTGFFFSWWMVEQGSSFGILYLIISIVLSTIVYWIIFGMGYIVAGFMIGVIVALCGLSAGWWLIGSFARELYLEEVILVTPILSTLYQRIFNPPTYYVMDTALMFQQAVHNTVIEVIDQVTTANGVRALSEFERKPVLKSFGQSA